MGVYRYNGQTGSFLGIYCQSDGGLKSPWGIKFEKSTNHTYISSEQTHNIVRLKPPSHGLEHVDNKTGPLMFRSDFDQVWTKHPLQTVTGFDFSFDSVYAVSPTKHGVVQYSRMTGERVSFFEDVALSRPTDIKVWNTTLFVCSNDNVRVYDRMTTEYLWTHIQYTGMQCATMLVHTDWTTNQGVLGSNTTNSTWSMASTVGNGATI